MRIRNRIKLMIAVENHYYNRKGAISLLIGITVALLVFNLVFNIFYCFGILETENNLAAFRNSAYILIAYLLLFISYRVTLRYAGIRYTLIMFFTSLSFLACTASGYLLFRAAFCWSLNRLIENPLGFEPLLRRAYSDSLRCLFYIAAAYFLVSLIPAIRRRPFLLGRFWIFNLFAPLVIIGFLTAVIVFAPAETRIEYARLSCVVYLSGMLWLSFRYSLKTLYYLILLPSERKLKLDDIPKRRVLFRGMQLQKTEAEPVSMPQASRPEPIDVRIVPANSPLRLTSLGNTADSRPGVRTLPVLDISKAEQEEQIYKSRGLFSCAFEIVGIEEPSIVPENALESMPYSVFESAPAESESAPQKTEIKKEETQKPSPLLRLSYTAERISGI